jgi:hypothetical protein
MRKIKPLFSQGLGAAEHTFYKLGVSAGIVAIHPESRRIKV